MNHNPKLHLFHAHTRDGWEIALHRYERKNNNRSPVVLVHGLASNRHNFDFPVEEMSLAKYLWKKGWDTWVVELRGAGLSPKPPGFKWLTHAWNFDHYVLEDMPAAVQTILKITHKKKLHWIGHSLGGLLVYAYMKTQGDQHIKSIITAASPMSLDYKPAYFKWTSKLDTLFRLIPLIPYRSLAKMIKLNPRWALKAAQYNLFSIDNMDPKTLELAAQFAIDDVSSGVLKQVHYWMREKKFLSSDGKINYALEPEDFRVPLFVITGSTDPFTPLDKINLVFNRIGSKKKRWIIFGKEHGHKTEYGHVDLIVGRNASREVFPLVAQWLDENDGR